MALVVPVFRKGAFKYAKNHLFKDMPEAGFNKFKDLKTYDLYRKLSDKSIEDRQHILNINKLQDRFTPEIRNELLTKMSRIHSLKLKAVLKQVHYWVLCWD